MGSQRREADGRLLAAQPGVQHVPEGAHAAVSHGPQHAHGVLGPPVRVVGLQQDADAGVGGERGDRAEPAGGRRVGLLRRPLAPAGEHPYVRRPDVPRQPDQLGELRQHRLVGPGGGHSGVPGHGQDGHARVRELHGHRRPLCGGDARVHGLLGVGAQLHAVVTAGGGEPYHVAGRHPGDAEGRKGQLHASFASPWGRGKCVGVVRERGGERTGVPYGK
ncbi:hypothetical protein GCM10010214_34890 [Streptomyces abikoensis]|nr:hypothetical protein GCM10010214_34890 [Streptomyces abikoensis]